MCCDDVVRKVLLDLFALFGVSLPLILVLTIGRPYESGYFLTDDSILYPFVVTSIHPALLGCLGFGLIIITVLLVELLRDRRKPGLGSKTFCGCLVPGVIWESYKSIGIFSFGAACQQLLVYLAKYTVGRLRPHFMRRCNPRPFASGGATETRLGYIQIYNCWGSLSTSDRYDLYQSFPSGYASFAVYTAVFFILYTNGRGKWQGSTLLRPLAQFSTLLAAWYVGLSRYLEYHNHWSDVAAGFLIGTIFAIVAHNYLLMPRKRAHEHESNEHFAPPMHMPPPHMQSDYNMHQTHMTQ